LEEVAQGEILFELEGQAYRTGTHAGRVD